MAGGWVSQLSAASIFLLVAVSCRREEGRNRAASSYSELLNQVLDFFVVFLLFFKDLENPIPNSSQDIHIA